MDLEAENQHIQPNDRFSRNRMREEQKMPKEESKYNEEDCKYEGYMFRCKRVGRIGPKQVTLDEKSSHGGVIFANRDHLDVEATSNFASVRGNTGVFSGRYYYEVLLKTNGLMQIGWCTMQTPFNNYRGVGDDATSYAYDGCRIKKWNNDNLTYGEAWSVGDIIGTLIDFDKKIIQYWRNSKSLGRAFTNVKVGANCVYFPAISFQRGQRVVFNFGRQQMCVTQNQLYALLEEPDAEINNYKRVCTTIIDYLKSYLISFWEFPRIAVE